MTGRALNGVHMIGGSGPPPPPTPPPTPPTSCCSSEEEEEDNVLLAEEDLAPLMSSPLAEIVTIAASAPSTADINDDIRSISRQLRNAVQSSPSRLRRRSWTIPSFVGKEGNGLIRQPFAAAAAFPDGQTWPPPAPPNPFALLTRRTGI